MKIKRFVNTDMRQVLRQVHEDQGPDAVILSNRRVDDGIEVIAAVDYDEALMQQALGPPSLSQETRSSKETVATVMKSDTAKKNAPGTDTQDQDHDEQDDNVAVVATDLQANGVSKHEWDAGRFSPSRDLSHHQTALDSLQSEVSNMRGMLETQLSSLIWRDTARQSPMRAQILRNLTKIGIGPDVAHIVLNRLEPVHDAKELWRAPLTTLANIIPLADDDLLRDGGVAAFVGPTGVGKTTTIAKMASRYAMQFGSNEIALISADAHRIGAHEHLSTFANILGVKIYPAEDLTVLEQLLDQLGDKRLVLIDTEGTSQRDIGLTARLAAFGKNEDRVRFYLTLAATCQEAGLDETVRVFHRLPLSGAIITKIDEAAQLGCALSALIRHDLPAVFLCDGQRIPDDLHYARKKRLWLVNQAVDCMRASKIRIDEETMIRKFGNVGEAHA